VSIDRGEAHGGARRRWRRPAGLALGLAAAALGVSAGHYGLQARQAADDVSRTYDGTDATWGHYGMEREAQGVRAERNALLSASAALVCAGLAVWLLIRGDGR
jgi:hypothetical protein